MIKYYAFKFRMFLTKLAVSYNCLIYLRVEMKQRIMFKNEIPILPIFEWSRGDAKE